MSQVGNLIGTQRAASAGVLGPAEHPGLEECAIDDQLPASLEQVEQANLTLGSCCDTIEGVFIAGFGLSIVLIDILIFPFI